MSDNNSDTPDSKRSLKNLKEHSTSRWRKITAGWRPYIENPLSLEDLDEMMMVASIPSFGYFFMLFLSAVIATLGLLSNSAPAIIGAMIIAPLMAPIVGLSYGIDIVDWRLVRRSFLTVVTGVILVIAFSYLSTRLIGLRVAGTEILSRTAPTLLDLGVAMAAGAAAAFSYTRKSISSSIAGVAIAVALVPPLAVTGIGLAYGRLATTEAGLSLTELGHYSGGVDIAKGSFILFATNFLGIIFVACITLLSQGYGQWKKAGVGLLVVLIASIVIIDPLERALYKLTVKSEVLSLIVSLPKKYPHIFSGQGKLDSINVRYKGDDLHVGIDVYTPGIKLPDEENERRIQNALDVFRENLEEKLEESVIVELDVISIELFSGKSGGEHLNPVGYKSPNEREKDKSKDGSNKPEQIQ